METGKKNVSVGVTQAFNSHGDILSYLLVWQYDIFQLRQVTAFSTLHQHEGSLPMDTLPAVDSLCVLSLFQVERFIGKLAGSLSAHM